MTPEAREAIIEHRRLMKAQRQFAARNRERIAAEWDALPEPVMTIAQHIEHARRMRPLPTPPHTGGEQ